MVFLALVGHVSHPLVRTDESGRSIRAQTRPDIQRAVWSEEKKEIDMICISIRAGTRPRKLGPSPLAVRCCVAQRVPRVDGWDGNRSSFGSTVPTYSWVFS